MSIDAFTSKLGTRGLALAVAVVVLLLIVCLRPLLYGGGAIAREIEDQDHLDRLVSNIDSEDELVAMQAVTDLGRFNAKTVSEELAAALKDPRPNVRVAASKALGRLEVWETMPNLIDALEDEVLDVRVASYASIVRMMGIDYGFDPEAKVSVRRRFIATLRSKYQKEHEAFLAWQKRKAERQGG